MAGGRENQMGGTHSVLLKIIEKKKRGRAEWTETAPTPQLKKRTTRTTYEGRSTKDRRRKKSGLLQIRGRQSHCLIKVTR